VNALLRGKSQTPKGQTPKDAPVMKSNFSNLAFEISLAFGRLGFGISP
jgi:hypothetical protein